jgi:hypothetical protein
MKHAFTLLFTALFCASLYAADLDTLLSEISDRTVAVFDRSLVSEQTVRVGTFKDKTFRVYDYSVSVRRADGTEVVETQVVYVYDEGGGVETAVCSGAIRKNEPVPVDEPDVLEVGEALLKQMITNAVEIPYSRITLGETGVIVIAGMTVMEDIKVGGEDRVRLRLRLSDGKTVIRCVRLQDGDLAFDDCAE